MGDGLIIGGGGSVAVGTDELFEAAARLATVTAALEHCQRELASVDRLVSAGRLRALDAPPESFVAERAIDDALVRARLAQATAASLRSALDVSADAYGLVERASESLAESAAATVGYGVGLVLPGIVIAALPLIADVGLAGAIVAALPKEQREALLDAVSTWFQQHSSLLSSPAFVEAVRLTVTSTDDLAAGVMHLPPGFSQFLESIGVGGVPLSSATIIAGGAMAGLLTESAVETHRSSSSTKLTAPSGWADRAARVPSGESQVRIDRYEEPDGTARFEVYVSGTRDFGIAAGSQPFDMTSNLHGIAGDDAGSIEAVRQAMAQAGIDSSTPIVITGHSQGGLVAARIAGSGDYNVQALFTLGAPASQVAVPDSVPWVALEHKNDIVPALSGSWTKSDPVIVSRELYTDGIVPHDVFFPAHQLSAYTQTAALLDSSSESRVAAAASAFDAFTAGSTPAETTRWTSTRVARG